jgi:hypothetical protein
MKLVRMVARAMLAVGVLAIWNGCQMGNERSPNAACSSTVVTAGAHAVVCPGATGCGCEAPSACCLSRIDSSAGACAAPRECAGIALTCDGPEDCGGGVCCLDVAAGLASCSAASECRGVWLCRSTHDCAGSPSGSSCNAADFGENGVADRGLDGRIAICGDAE